MVQLFNLPHIRLDALQLLRVQDIARVLPIIVTKEIAVENDTPQKTEVRRAIYVTTTRRIDRCFFRTIEFYGILMEP